MNERFEPSADVVATELDDAEIALLDLGTKTYFSLNSTGTCIWQGLKRGHTLHDISASLQREFDVGAADADRSVIDLVEQLLRQKLLWRAATSD